MAAILLSPLYILLNLYLAARILLWLRTIHSAFGSLWFMIPFLAFFVLAALSPLPAAFGRGRIRVISRAVSNGWLGVMLYFPGLLLLLDLGRIALCLAGRRSILTPFHPEQYRIAGSAVFGIVVLLIAYGAIHAAHIKTVRYPVTIAKRGTPSGTLRIALVADLHLGGTVGLKQMQKIKRHIDAIHPDLIVYAGDIFDNDFDAIAQPDEIAALLRTLHSTWGSFACWGNHDIQEAILAGFTFNTGSRPVACDPRMEQFLDSAGIRLLTDETLLLADSFYLSGRLDASCLKKSGIVRMTARELLSGLDPEKPILVLDHQPSELEELAEAGADLILSGHTHDGQIFPGNLTTRIGWKNSRGMLKIGNATSIVTSGAGVWGPALRIGTDSEVVEICVTFAPCGASPEA